MTSITGKVAALLLAASLPHHHLRAQAVEVGDEVCITGYIMDNYCLFTTGGRLLDDRDVITLQNPEKHSFHCLLDVGVCYESGFQVLGEKDPDTDRHCLGFRLDSMETVLEAGRAYGMDGYCSTCGSDEDDAPEFGYRATVRGIVEELGDGSESITGPPLLTNIELLDESVQCENPTIPPMCVRSSDVPEPTPSPTEVPTDKPSTAAPSETTKAPVAPPLKCPDTLDKSTEIDSLATFYYAMVPSNPPGSGNGILCGRIEAENDGWVGLAISRDGNMIGSEAIIGTTDDGTVLKYDLNGKAGSLVTAMSDNKQTLRDTSLSQEDGQTVMEFTKLLVEDGEIPIVEGDNIFLHARGGSSLGYHVNGRGMFNVDLSTSLTLTNSPSASPVIAPSSSPTTAPMTASPSLSPARSPTISPISKPSTSPQAMPSNSPTNSPQQGTNAPTSSPSTGSTAAITAADPTDVPTVPPSNSPEAPSVSPITQSSSKAPTLAPVPLPTTYAPPAANMTTTLPPVPEPSDEPSVSPVMMPVSIPPTTSPVTKANLPELTEPPFSSSSAGTVGAGLISFLLLGVSLALCENLL